MKLSCLPVSLYDDLSAGRMTLGEWVRCAASLGLDGADLSVTHLPRGRSALADLRRQAGDAGVRLPILVTYTDFTHPDPAYRSRQSEEMRVSIEAASELGVENVRVTAGQAYPEVAIDAALDWAVEGIVTAASDGEAAGIRILYENHVRGAIWTFNDLTQPASLFLEVVRRTRHTSLRVLFDTANCSALDDSPDEVLNEVIERLGAVHLSDIKQCGSFEPTLLGTGIAPLHTLCRTIVSTGFDGWVSVEEASRTGPEGIARAVNVADRLWVESGGVPRRRDARPNH